MTASEDARLNNVPIDKARAKRIAELNDRLRCHGEGGRLFVTASVMRLEGALPTVLQAVQAHDNFTPGNDPYGEHDFGMVVQLDTCFYWKIDYYDLSLAHGSPDPANPAVTTRVLTIMLAEEY